MDFAQPNGNLFTIQDWEKLAREAEFKPGKMAALCSLSDRQLQRLFKENAHCTPSKWLRELQCRLSKDLICKGYSNKAVAEELEFANASHFCREFKKQFGVSPQSFALAHQNAFAATIRKPTGAGWAALRATM